jgi:hypothetical protein
MVIYPPSRAYGYLWFLYLPVIKHGLLESNGNFDGDLIGFMGIGMGIKHGLLENHH